MQANGLIPAEYPVKRNLESFWVDSTLYFSTIPRDVLLYCVETYLSWNVTEELAGQTTSSTTLVGIAQVLPAGIGTPIILRDGNFLGVQHINGWSDLCYINPRSAEPTVVWLIKAMQGYRYSYDRIIDTLYIYEPAVGNYRVIAKISQRALSRKQFFKNWEQYPVFKGCPPEVIDPKLIFKPLTPITVNYRSQAVTLPLDRIDNTTHLLVNATFYGGYLILILWVIATQESIVHWYRTVD